MLQVRARQDVGGGAQQLLGAAAVQTVVTAVGRAEAIRGAPQNPTVPAKRAPSGTHSLTAGSTGDHREVLTEAIEDKLSFLLGIVLY